MIPSRVRFSFCFYAICFALPSTAQPPPPPPPEYEITGQVLDAQTHAPVPRATVTAIISGADGTQSQLVILTSPAGTFTIRAAPAGSCQLLCRRPGYLEGSSASVSSLDGKPARAVLYLTGQAVISGMVVDERGFGLPDTQIQAFQEKVVEGRRQIQQIRSDATDDTGEFRIAGLAAGRYYIGVAGNTSGLSRKLTYARTFYPESLEVSGAQSIDLRAGQEERIQMRLAPKPAGEVRGTFPLSDNRQGVSIMLQRYGLTPAAMALAGTYDFAHQTFKIARVPAGTYTLEISTMAGGSLTVRAGAVVTTDGRDLAGVVLTARSSPLLIVTMREEGPPTHPFSFLTLKSPSHAAGAQVDAAGAFRFPDLPADIYRVIMPQAGSSYIRSIVQGGRDAMRDGIIVGESAAPVEITVSPRGATIEGEIKLADSEDPGPLVVALLKLVGDEMVMEKQAYCSPIQPRGFAMPGVAPGDYVLYAWRHEAEPEYTNPEYMRPFLADGLPVRVNEGEKVTVTLQHILAPPQR